MKYQIAILAGGLASRLHPISLNLPKSLIPVFGRPFISWQLELLAKSGIESIVLCLGHKAQEIIEYVGDGSKFGLEIQYSVEKSSLGTGGALKQAEILFGDCFGVLYGDSYLPINYQKIFHVFEASNYLGIMSIYRNENQFDLSNVMIDSKGFLKYSKKTPNPKMSYIDYGFSIFRRSVLAPIEKGTKFDLGDLLEKLSLDNQISFYEIDQRFYEVGSFSGILQLQNYLEGEKK